MINPQRLSRDPDVNWENNELQFMRLIAELETTGVFTADAVAKVAEEMDVSPSDVAELIDRAQTGWDDIKIWL